MAIDPGHLPGHLVQLESAFEPLLDQLKDADTHRRQALRAHAEAYATAYVAADVPKSAEQLRKQVAIGTCLDEAAELEKWESEVKFCRDQLAALRERVGVARSLLSYVKEATS